LPIEVTLLPVKLLHLQTYKSMKLSDWLHCNPNFLWVATFCFFWISTLSWLGLTGIKPTNISTSLKTPVAEVNLSIQIKDNKEINYQLSIPNKANLFDH
jgi:hypothetical protein